MIKISRGGFSQPSTNLTDQKDQVSRIIIFLLFFPSILEEDKNPNP